MAKTRDLTRLPSLCYIWSMATEAWKQANPEKLRLYRRRWYQKNKRKQITQQAIRRAEIKQFVRDLKVGKSCGCGESHPATLDFHHRDPKSKIIAVSQIALHKGWSKERILAEVAKCDLICSNCHRKLHSPMG